MWPPYDLHEASDSLRARPLSVHAGRHEVSRYLRREIITFEEGTLAYRTKRGVRSCIEAGEAQFRAV